MPRVVKTARKTPPKASPSSTSGLLVPASRRNGDGQSLLFNDANGTSTPGPADGGSAVHLLEPCDVIDTLGHIKQGIRQPVEVVMLDPWYNKGVGGARPDYDEWLAHVVKLSAEIANHVYVWGFPEIIWRLLDRLPEGLTLLTWLTWYYKNCPSVIRGWRSAQYTCLHLVKAEAPLYPEHFLNDAQLQKQQEGKLRYMPGPASVIDVPLNIGFVGRREQTGHPSQKPEKVIEPLILMATKEGDLVLDPMCGSGTTGAVCRKLGRRSVLCDISEEYTSIAADRLQLKPMKAASLSEICL